MDATQQEPERASAAHQAPRPGYVRTLAFVAEIAARALESHDYQLLPTGLLESVFGHLATASDRLGAVAQLYHRWEAGGARFPQRYYLHVAEPAGSLLVMEAHHAYSPGTPARRGAHEWQIITSIARELGITLDNAAAWRRGRPGQVHAVRAVGTDGRRFDIATRSAPADLAAYTTSGSAAQQAAISHVCTRILVAPLAELLIERTPGLMKP